MTQDGSRPSRRRRYLREYFSWLAPHRFAVSAVILLALTRAGLEMIEPLFMRYIVDKVLLNQTLDQASRLYRRLPRSVRQQHIHLQVGAKRSDMARFGFLVTRFGFEG